MILKEIQQLTTHIDTVLPQTKVVYKTGKGKHLTSKEQSSNQQMGKDENKYHLFDEVKKKGHKVSPPKHLQ